MLDILGRPADALVCYDRALAIQPDFAEAMLNRCGALRGLKRIDETMQSLERLLTVHPAYAEAHGMRAMLMADFNRYPEALASFERALALKPDYSKARWGSCTAALPILYAEASEIAAQRADYERRLRARCKPPGIVASRCRHTMTAGGSCRMVILVPQFVPELDRGIDSRFPRVGPRFRTRCGGPDSWPGWEATNSPCCSKASMLSKRRPSSI